MTCPNFFNSNLIKNGINSLTSTNPFTNSKNINKGEYKKTNFFMKSNKSKNILLLLKVQLNIFRIRVMIFKFFLESFYNKQLKLK